MDCMKYLKPQEPVPHRTGGAFLDTLDESILAIIRDQETDNNAVRGGRQDFGRSAQLKKTQLLWWKRHQDQVLKKYGEGHDK
jgi:hypothetical protein